MDIKNIIMDKINYDNYSIDLSNIYIYSSHIDIIIEILNEIYIEHIHFGLCIIRDTENIYQFTCKLFTEISNMYWIKSIYIDTDFVEKISNVHQNKILLSYLLDNSNIEEITICTEYMDLDMCNILKNSKIKKLHTNIKISKVNNELNLYENLFINNNKLYSLEISHNKYMNSEHHKCCYNLTSNYHYFDSEIYHCNKLPQQHFFDQLESKILFGGKIINSIFINLCGKNIEFGKVENLNNLILLLIKKNQINTIIITIPKYKYPNDIVVAIKKNNVSLKYCYPIIPGFNGSFNKICCDFLIHLLIIINKTKYVQYNGQYTIFNNNFKILPKHICMIIYEYVIVNVKNICIK